MKAKPHWTQTEAGKAKLSRMLKKQWTTTRRDPGQGSDKEDAETVEAIGSPRRKTKRQPCQYCGKTQWPRWLTYHEARCTKRTDEEPDDDEDVMMYKNKKRSKASEKAGADGNKGSYQSSGSSNSTDALVAFLFGSITEKINSYSQSSGIPETILTSRISELLHHKARGQRVGTFN